MARGQAGMIVLDSSSRHSPIDVPSDIADCPICGKTIVVEDVMEWEDPSGKPLQITIECTTEPDIDSDDWPEWHRWHWSTPYIDWLPVEKRVLKWFRKNYRCK